MNDRSEPAADAAQLKERLARFHAARERILGQVRQVIVGQEEVLEQILTALLVGGHCLITGLPGTAKTLMVRTLARTLGLEFRRIQFTPDLMPADITGTDIVEEDATTGRRRWTFVPGPLFGNIVLADEINRTPPKTQSALLEAMQEMSCTVRGTQYTLPRPFLVLATQNPIELEGTYPLPEAQLDRFLFNTVLDYLSAADELTVIERTTTTASVEVEPVTNAAELLDFQALIRAVPVSETLARQVVRLVRATRHRNEDAPPVVKRYVSYGASVRAAQFIVLAGKARALAQHRYHVVWEDVLALAAPVLRHRILLNFHAESDRIDADEILRQLLAQLPAPAGS
jgi:MoxR-like ATPase